MEAGRADPTLYRGPAGELRLPDRTVPVLGIPDVRRGRNDEFDRACFGQGDFRCFSAIGEGSEKARHASGGTAAATGREAAKVDARIADLQAEIGTLEAVKSGKIDASFHLADGYLGGLSNQLGEAAKNPELLWFKLKTNAYKFSWALIPLSVPFVWLLFPFSRRFHIYDHTVFVTYSLCFMMLLLATSSVVGLVSDSIASLAWFLPPFHMYRQLRGTYELTKKAAVWRTILLTIFAFIAISVFASLLVTLGAFE